MDYINTNEANLKKIHSMIASKNFDFSSINEIYNYLIHLAENPKLSMKIFNIIAKYKITEIFSLYDNPNSLKLTACIISRIVNNEYMFIMDTYYADKSFYYEIQAILSSSSFRETIYNILNSEIMRNFYDLNGKEEDRIMNKAMIKGYTDLRDKMKNKEALNDFFDKTFCVMNLPKDIKGFTNRYLRIAINYSAIVISVGLEGIDGTKEEEEFVKSIPLISCDNIGEEIQYLKVIHYI